MDLFKIVPENFFSIFTSKSRNIYLDALLIVRKAFKIGYNIKKEDLISLFIEGLQDRVMEIETEDDEDYPEENSISAYAYRLFRRLKSTGWLNVEYLPNSFDEYIILEDYARRILNLIYDIMNMTQREYNGYVYQTYAILKDANERRDDYMYQALIDSYNNTLQLDDALKGLLNNIKQYHQILNEQKEIKDMLKGHFEFKSLIANKIIHPIKTFDSIPRFKIHILNILKEWQYDSDLKDILVNTAMVRSNYKNVDEARENVVIMIGEIIQIYSDIESLIDEIDRKNNGYTRAWAQKIIYSLNEDRSIKGKLIEILKSVGKLDKPDSEEVFNVLAEVVILSKQTILDDASTSKRNKKRNKSDFKPLKTTIDVNGKDTLGAEYEFRKRLKNSYTIKKISDFVNTQFKDKLQINSEELNLEDKESFILLILAVLRSNEQNMGYNVEFKDGYIYIDGYRIPDLTFIKKGK